MKAQIIPIGNSRGIRIPKTILQQCEISDEVELSVEGRQIVLSPRRKAARAGWSKAAAQMATVGDDELLIPAVFADHISIDWQ